MRHSFMGFYLKSGGKWQLQSSRFATMHSQNPWQSFVNRLVSGGESPYRRILLSMLCAREGAVKWINDKVDSLMREKTGRKKMDKKWLFKALRATLRDSQGNLVF